MSKAYWSDIKPGQLVQRGPDPCNHERVTEIDGDDTLRVAWEDGVWTEEDPHAKVDVLRQGPPPRAGVAADRWLRIRVTDDELSRWRAAAAERGESLSHGAREAIEGRYNAKTPPR